MRISKNKGKLPYAYSLSESLKYKEPKNSTKQMVIFYVHTAAGKKKSNWTTNEAVFLQSLWGIQNTESWHSDATKSTAGVTTATAMVVTHYIMQKTDFNKGIEECKNNSKYKKNKGMIWLRLQECI